MSNDLDAFMIEASKISERQAQSNRNGAELGYYFCRPMEAGFFLDPNSTPAYISQARTCTRFTNTPGGIALWQASAQETQTKLALLIGENPSKAAEPEVQSPFPTIKLST